MTEPTRQLPGITKHPLVGTYGWPIGTTDEQKKLGAVSVLRVDNVFNDYHVMGSTSCGRTFATSIGMWKRLFDSATAEDWNRLAGPTNTIPLH